MNCQKEQKQLILSQLKMEIINIKNDFRNKKTDHERSIDFKIINDFKDTPKTHRPRNYCLSEANCQDSMFSRMKNLFGGR